MKKINHGVVILWMHFLRACLSWDSFLCSGNPEAHAKDTEGFQSIFTQQLLPKNLSKVGILNGNFNEANTNTLQSSVTAILTPPLMITNLNLTQAHLYPLQPMQGRFIYNQRYGSRQGRTQLSKFRLTWCYLFPVFSLLSEGNVPKVARVARGKGRIQKSSSTAQLCYCCHLDWREPTHIHMEGS